MSTKPKLFITPEVVVERNISKDEIDSLRQWFDVHTVEGRSSISRQELVENVRGAFAILCTAGQPMNEEIVKAAGPSLKVISQPAAGFNNIDKEVMKKYSVRVGLAGSAITAAAAEMAVAILLAHCRFVVKLVNDYKNLPRENFDPKCPVAVGLEDSIVGIVGGGRVGHSIAKKLMQFDVKKLIYSNLIESPHFKALGCEWTSMENVAENSDYMIVALPYSKETNKIIGKKIIDLMKPNAVLVNIGRGDVVDQDYLVEALRTRQICGAALDVTIPDQLPLGHPLFQLDNVLITPHVGGLSVPANQKSAKIAIENIKAVLNNQPMLDELKL